MRHLVAAIVILLGTWPAFAVQPNEMLDDPALETRARTISSELRCLVCQNQSIDDSDAPLASELRVIVRERLVAGDSNAQVLQYVVDRYGEFVLLRPVLGLHTLLLWAAGPLILVAGIVAVLLVARRRQSPMDVAPVPLSEDEQRALDELSGGRN